MGSPVARWRRSLAYQVVAGHRLAMFALFFAPIAFVVRLLDEEHPGADLWTIGLMGVGFVGSLWFVPWLLAVSPRPARRGTVRRTVLRLYRMFVGNGDAIQALARRIHPGWRNPYTGRTPQETAHWLASVEVIHWALLVAFVVPAAAAFWYGHYALGFVCVAANVLYNLVPNLVMRDTRARLLRLSGRGER